MWIILWNLCTLLMLLTETNQHMREVRGTMAMTDQAIEPVTEVFPEWSLGDRLAKARRHANIKQQSDMAEKLTELLDKPVSTAAVSAWERDVNEPTQFTTVVRAWARITGVSAEWIAGFRTGRFARESLSVVPDDQAPELPLDWSTPRNLQLVSH